MLQNRVAETQIAFGGYTIKPNTHRRRRRDETVLSRRRRRCLHEFATTGDQCLNCRGVGRVEPPQLFSRPTQHSVRFCIGGSVHTAHVRFTSQFGKTLWQPKKTQPPSYFSTIQTLLVTDSAMRTHNAAVGRDPIYNTVANGSRLPTGVFTPPTQRDSTVSFRRRRRCVLGISHKLPTPETQWVLQL